MKFNGLDLNLLIALDALFTEKSVSRAAVRLGLTQSAMSSALGRLREYFSDNLVVQIDRRMVPTPRGEALVRLVREAIIHLSTITTTPAAFDPATSTRNVNIIASDYILQVILNRAIRRISNAAPNMQVTIWALDDQVAERLDRAEVDILITVIPNLSTGHPYEFLFEDDYVAVAWSENSVLRTTVLNMDLYSRLPHVIVTHGRSQIQTFEYSFIKSLGISRHVQVQAPSFTSVMGLIVGTDRIATVHRRLARQCCDAAPFRMHGLPFQVPSVRLCAQTHFINKHDPEINWILSILKEEAAGA